MSLIPKAAPNQDEFLPFARPNISDEAIAEVVDCLKSGWITTGPRVQKFEEALQDYLKAPHALAISSATAGLYVALKALELKPGDEVITTSMTFAATLNVIVLAGGKPVLVDVCLDHYNMDIAAVENAITNRARAIMPVHFAGLPVDLDPLYDLARKHELHIIEDASHAIGAYYKGKIIGSFGDTQVFSFHPNKNMTTGEGGAITVRSNPLKEKIERQRFHGMDRMAWNRFAKNGSQHYEIVEPAHKFNMMDIQGALGIHQLNSLDSFIAERERIVTNYYAALKDFDCLILPSLPSYSFKHAWHLFAPRVNFEATKLSRDDVALRLKELNIGTGLHYRAPHLYPFYTQTYGFKEGQFPNAEMIGNSVMSLPLFPGLKDSEFDRVISALKNVFSNKE